MKLKQVTTLLTHVKNLGQKALAKSAPKEFMAQDGRAVPSGFMARTGIRAGISEVEAAHLENLKWRVPLDMPVETYTPHGAVPQSASRV